MSTVKDVHSPLLPQTSKSPTSPTVTPAAPSASKPSKAAASPGATPTPVQTSLTPKDLGPRKADTYLSWGAPAGLAIRGPNDENLVIFRKALGINYHREATDAGTLEEGRKSAIGIYKSVITAQERKYTQYALLTAFLYFCYFAQVVVGAALTAMGPASADYPVAITVLGAVNTIIAGILALIKGSGQPQRLGKDRVGFRRLQGWIEETEALLAVGVIGRNRKEVGLLVESAFKRYNAAKRSEENNDPELYVNQPMEATANRASEDSGPLSGKLANGK
ncbi:hypothetical protein F4779DRAFT_633071 [Xylariaceae sp. FL0662B]|nr:hypothetical protein F4779DRAFT_633071 [Xylariaceae sp. FL0662B]